MAAVVESIRDTAKQREAEWKPHQNQARHRVMAEHLAEHLLDIVGLVETTGLVRHASPSIARVLGYSPSELEGKTVFDLVYPDDRAALHQEIAHLVATKTPCHMELRCQHVNGHLVPLDARCTPLLNREGEVQQIVVVARDIMERKHSDAWHRKSERLAVVGRLAAGIAHEIRNPLTAIKGFVQLLEQETDRVRYVEVMMSEITRLNDIVTELLTLATDQTISRRIIHPRTLLEPILMIMRSRSSLHSIEIEEQYDSDLPCLLCDENQLKRAFINILKNAIESMSDGGTIRIQVTSVARHLMRFRIVDQGCGIPHERMVHLGEPFYSSREKGTGLGLMVSYKIIEEHGGTIHIASTVNKGTTVDVILPIHTPGLT